MFFRCSINKTCDITNVVLSGNIIDYVHKTKYLGILLCADMKTSIDVYRQTSKFYAQANTLLRNFRYCSDDVKCILFRSFCTNMYCSPLWFNSTSSSIKKLKTSYNGALRQLLLKTRCTRGDARSFFCTYKMYLYAQNYFLKNILKYCFKSYIKLHEYANCNLANYDV